MASKKRKRRRKSAAAKKTGGGVMGMRSGIKKVVKSVGSKESKSSTGSNIVWILLLLAALGFMIYRSQ